MRATKTRAELALLQNDPIYSEPLHRMVTLLPSMWASNAEVAYRIGGSDKEARKTVYKLTDAIVNTGIWQMLTVMHNNLQLKVVNVDPDALREALAEVDE